MMASLAIEKILNTDINGITKTFMEDMFAAYHDRQTGEYHESNFDPTEDVVLTNKEYKWVKDRVSTTPGQLLFNRYILERIGLSEHLGYWDIPIDSSGLKKLNAEVNNLALLDKITIKQLGEYIDSRDRLGFWAAAFLSVSISPALIRPMDNVNKRKNELFQQKASELNSDNPVTQIMAANSIEKELMSMVRENLKNDTGYDMYRSGDGNLDNNYKTINVMRGAVFNDTTKKYDIVENSLMNGVKKENITAFANSVLEGAYPSAVGTADAGYMAKIILALLQSEHIDPDPNSDCGTKATIPVTVTKKNTKYLLFRNINDNGKIVQTDLHNINDYIGKTVQVYSPQCCTRDAICGKCAGKLFHNLGVTNVGLLTTQVTQKVLNLKLKSKHNLSQNAGIIPDNYIFLHDNKFFKIDEGNLINLAKVKFFIPRILDELDGFVKEPTTLSCMGIFPVKFYDNSDNVILETSMIVPAVLDFNVYNDIQEDPENYTVTYEPGSNICSLGVQKSIVNVEYFINQIYLYSKSPQIPYNIMTDMMFRCLEINSIDLTGPSITYELLARRVCRSGDKPFSTIYGKDPTVDPMSYTKLGFREAVHTAGALQSILFQDISAGMNKGLAMTLNGIEPTPTPLETVIKS